MSKRPEYKPGLNEVLNSMFFEMIEEDKDSEKFAKMVNNVETLYKLKEVDSKKRVSPDTMLVVAGNLLGIILIVGHERAHVITSRAIGFVMKATK